MFVYFLLMVAAFVLGGAPLVVERITRTVPRALQPLWPWRPLLVVLATLLAFLILLSFLVRGSGFEDAVNDIIEKRTQAAVAAADLISDLADRLPLAPNESGGSRFPIPAVAETNGSAPAAPAPPAPVPAPTDTHSQRASGAPSAPAHAF